MKPHAPDRPVGFKYLYIPYDGQPHSPSGDAWDERGVIVAKCRQIKVGKPPHPFCGTMPNENCGCGIYGAFDLSLCNQHDGWYHALFLIEGFGKCIISQNGFRAEIARIIAIVRTSWCVVNYNEITVYPTLPRISLDAALVAIHEYRAQWLAMDDESKQSANIGQTVSERRAIKAIPRTPCSMVKSDQ